jgi:hypothetical protein
VEIRFDEVKASRLISQAGFLVEEIRDIGQYHYIVIAKPGPALP